MGGGGGDPNNPTSFSKEKLTNELGSGISSYYKNPEKVLDKPLYAGLSDTTQGGLAAMLGAAGNNDFASGLSGAMKYTSDVAAGNRFGEQAPGYADVRNNAINDTIVAGNSPFLSSGTYGSDKHRETLGRGISQTVSGMDYQNYQNDIARQQNAQAALPGLYQAMMLPGQTQLSVGTMKDADAQSKLLAESDLFTRQQDAEYNHLARALGLTGSGTIQNQQEQQPSNPFMDILGLGIAGAGAFL